MQLTMRLGAAISIAALGACSSEDTYADNADSNAAYTTNETVLPADDAPADTLGNQLNQLNESDSTVDTGSTDNTTTNGY
ncbi:MAG TPA: hypothetical protein VFR52_07920 [Sphingomicrobium sp.]|jgi:hypothetical protein|nr:hypothetical protein [Sphingomicrobium sp.]